MTVRVRACYMIHFRFHQDEDTVTICVRACYMIYFRFHQVEDTVTNCVGALVVLGYCSSITRLRLHRIQIEFSLELVKTWCSIITY